MYCADSGKRTRTLGFRSEIMTLPCTLRSGAALCAWEIQPKRVTAKIVPRRHFTIFLVSRSSFRLERTALLHTVCDSAFAASPSRTRDSVLATRHSVLGNKNKGPEVSPPGRQ